MRTYHYSVRIGRGKATFPTVALGSLRGSLAFFWKGHGVQSPWLAISQTYLSALFSCQRPDGYNQSRYELKAFNIKV
ncbi:transposase [Ruminococcus sp. AM45-9BH]|nr:transposase [Ruminococcus sp. AM45-9BH]RHS77741.1 transposase [Ruminococcus sp. AM45-2]